MKYSLTAASQNENLALFSVLNDSKLNIFRFWPVGQTNKIYEDFTLGSGKMKMVLFN